jgi:hypothetical protein
MNICVCGWHLFSDFLNILNSANKKYYVSLVTHKLLPYTYTIGMEYECVDLENRGLEFGVYDYYIKKLWDGKSDVLFMHDDVKILDISFFDKVNLFKDSNIDQAYIFKSQAEEKNNGGKHGRAIYMSSKLINFMLNYVCTCNQSSDHYDTHNPDYLLKGTGKHTGFWVDYENTDHVSGKPPKGVRHYNDMIYHYHSFLGRIRDKKLYNESMNVLNRIILSELDCARRGKFRVEGERN